MKVEARLFIVIAVFCWVAAIGYGIWTSLPNSFSNGNLEPVGVSALILSGGLMIIPGTFFAFVSRRIPPRPEDRADAEIAEMAGDLGFFSPGSYWPLGIAISASVAGFALAFVQVWLLIVAVFLILFSVGGLLFEYYSGGNRSTIA